MTVEQALRYSRELLRAVIEGTSDSVFVKDTQGRYLLFNGDVACFTGPNANEILGKDDTFLFPEQEAKGVMERDRKVIEGRKAITFEETVTTTTGQVKIYLSTKGPIFDEQGIVIGLFGVSRDITERKRAEEKLAWLASFPGLNPNPVVELDLSNNSIYYENPAARKLIPDLLSLGLNHPWLANASSIADELRRCGLPLLHCGITLGNRTYQQTWVFSNRDQRLRIYSIDITERLRADEALRQSEKLFRTLFEGAGDGIFIADATGRYIDVNVRGMELIGYSREELFDRKIADIVAEHERGRVPGEMALVLSGHPNISEWQFLRKDGSTFAGEVSAQLLPDGHVMGILRDITPHKKRNEELGRLNRTLKALSKSSQAMMRAIDEPQYLAEVCEIIIRDCGFAMVWIGYAENDEGKTVRPVAHAGLDDGYIKALNITWADTIRGRGATGTAIRTGKPCHCRNMLTDPQFAPWREEALKRGYASSLVLPLLTEGKAFGAVTIYSSQPVGFSDDEEKLLAELAGDLSHGLTELRLRAAQAKAEAAVIESEQRVRLKLESILSPEDDTGKLELADIIDVHGIQMLMESFYALAKIPMAVIDLKGKVLVGVGWQDVCTKFHRLHPETCKHCLESDTQLSSGISPGEFKLYKCKNNMWDAATPLMIGAQLMGHVFSGQFFFAGEVLDRPLFLAQARQYGFNEEAYLQALERAPRLTKRELENAMAFFMKLADMISKLSYSNLKLARTLEERGNLMRSLTATRDLLQKSNRDLEKRVQERTAKLQEAVGELEHFSYTITHDMRAPLRAMRGYGDMLLEKSEQFDSASKQFVQRINRSAERMDRLITDALDYSKLVRQEVGLKPVDCGALLREMLEMYPQIIDSRATITIDGDVPFVLGNEAALTQCFSNLLGNAVKFVEPGKAPEVRIWAEEKGDRLRIWFEDNGIGIDDHCKERIFVMFQRVNLAYEGTGIGLALVRKAAERMGGTVGVESEIGKGSRFWLELSRAVGCDLPQPMLS